MKDEAIFFHVLLYVNTNTNTNHRNVNGPVAAEEFFSATKRILWV